jgi:hypothetical protein
MDLFLYCPTDVLVYEFYPCLETRDVCRLDEAVTSSRALRPLLSELYRLLRGLTHQQHCTPGQLRWFFNRQIPLRQLLWTRDTSSEDVTSLLHMLLLQQHQTDKEKCNSVCTTKSTSGSEASLQQVSSSIREIDLSGCRGIGSVNEILNCCLLSMLLSPTSSSSSSFSSSSSSSSSLSCASKSFRGICFLGLRSLHLRHCEHITRPLLQRLCSFPLLATLDLSHCPCTLSPVVLSALSATLTTINLSHCSHLTDSALITLSQQCPHLTDLDVSDCYCLTDATLFALAVNCLHLAALRLCRCLNISAAAVVGLCSGCLHIQLLDLSHCQFFDTDEALSMGISVSNSDGSNSDANTSNSSDTTSANTSNTTKQWHWQCSSLLTLRMQACRELTGIALVRLSRSCPSLTVLDVSHCPLLSDAALFSLAQYCPALVSLSLSHCDNITHKAVTALLRGCPLLTLSAHQST